MVKLMDESLYNQERWNRFWQEDPETAWWLRPDRQVLNLLAELSPREYPHLLDLGCGLGRHAIAAAQAGFQVTAVDISQTALKHLRNWAQELDLAIAAYQAGALDEIAADGAFDVVISYNVIYHGRRGQFAQAITNMHRLLRPGGLFFFTCPSRQDGKYGYGKQVAPHTYLSERSMSPGDMHYFANKADLDELLTGFEIVKRRKDEGYWENQGQRQFFSNWEILAQRCE